VGPSHSFAPNFHFQCDRKDRCLWRHGVGFLIVAGFRETSCRRPSILCETGLEDSSFASVLSDDTRCVTLPTKRITDRNMLSWKSLRLFQCAMNGEWNVPYFSGAFAKLVMSICLSVRMEQLGFYWTDFNGTWYLGIFRKYVEKIQFSLKSDKNNGYLTWRSFHIYDNISLNSS
jgi:hypothetical protein